MQFSAVLFVALALPAAEYSTYIGDQNTWTIRKLVIDASGNTYVAGSRSFAATNTSEAIVAKLDTSGKTALLVNLGGKGNDVANALALDGAGNVYVAGARHTPAAPFPGGAGFVAKLSPVGEILYSIDFPSAVDAIAVDAAGAAYVTGTTYTRDFPTTPGLPSDEFLGFPRNWGAFLTKIDPFGAKIVFSTVISGHDKPCGCCSSCFTSGRGATGVAVGVDAAGNAYFTGNSDVVDLPTTPGVLTPTGSGAFVAKVKADGTALGYLTYIGSGGVTVSPNFWPANRVAAISVDAAGNAWVAGTNSDGALPISGAFAGVNDAFALKLNPTGTAVVWGAYLGGESTDEATAAALDAKGNFWIAGSTSSVDFPNRDGWSTGEDFIVEYDASGVLTYTARYPTTTVRQTIAADTLIHTTTTTGVVSATVASPHPLARPWNVGPAGGQVAAGLALEIYGPHIGGTGPVYFNDLPAPVLYSSDTQINVVVPFAIDGQKTARLRIGSGPDFGVVVLPAMPRIAAVVNEDGTVNSYDNPAVPGSIMTMWVAGAALPEPPVADGTIATSAHEYYVGTVTANGAPATVLYAGAAPGLIAGVAQINFVAPDRPASLVLTVRNIASAPFFIEVR
jgi:uncharacterized protein (TIGR03437 family)